MVKIMLLGSFLELSARLCKFFLSITITFFTNHRLPTKQPHSEPRLVAEEKK